MGTPAKSPRRWSRRLAPALLLTSLALLLFALARPQATIAEPRREGTVILAFDVSGSMAATDLRPSRMEAAKAAARHFVENQPSTVRVGWWPSATAGWSPSARPPAEAWSWPR